jgi:hypothetical protein
MNKHKKTKHELRFESHAVPYFQFEDYVEHENTRWVHINTFLTFPGATTTVYLRDL